ncbi:MAG: UDP-N-acetylmuramate--L-alanine ligase [Deltaproteobacteria bacterium]|jgi:UDP-N-acetylmuramate--alanine ligase|nr:UDP-N-acetylmuramate--L-alanine ligase [Deltaproteobacteria bacterium]
MFHRKRRVHFVGIGGIGMSGIAEVLLNLGHAVSGSDQQESAQTTRLSSMGAEINVGHRADLADGADVVVVSSAVPESNPELVRARSLSVPVIPRAEMLAELMRLKTSVAVAGSHGKTSTCSLVGLMLTQAGLDPTLVIGGKINNLGLNARLGQGEILVAEADESDGSFLMLSPTVTIVTNIDREHLSNYRDFDHLKDTFLTFINRVPFYGASILCLDDPEVQDLVPRVKKRFVTYGLSAQAEITARDIRTLEWGNSFEWYRKGQKLGRITLNIPGKHNVLNALAASAVGLEFGLSPETVAEGIAGLKGVGRRFELKGQAGGVTFLDDYGHHPTEIRATLATMAECYPDRRKIVLFQPHRHSRTKDLFDEFVKSFNVVENLFLADIYAAGEKPIENVDSEILARAIASHGHRGVEYLGAVGEMAGRLRDRLLPGDVVMTLGAGNIWQVGEELLKRLPADPAVGGHP